MSSPRDRRSKADALTAAARFIIDQDRKTQDAKTTRLKAARLAKEAEEAITVKTAKAKGRGRPKTKKE